MYEKYMSVLSNVVLFKNIEKENLGSMLHCLQPTVRSYKKNELITVGGEKFEGIGLLLTGEAMVSKENAAGNRVMMSLLKPGDMFGEMIAFSSKSKWPATVQAQEACSVMFLPRERIIGECQKVCSWHNVLIQNLLRIISEKALMLNKKVEFLTIKSMRGKISLFLLEQFKQDGTKTFETGMNRNELADFLNVSRPSLSRELGRMKEEGIIDYHLSTVRILDMEALKAFVE